MNIIQKTPCYPIYGDLGFAGFQTQFSCDFRPFLLFQYYHFLFQSQNMFLPYFFPAGAHLRYAVSLDIECAKKQYQLQHNYCIHASLRVVYYA